MGARSRLELLQEMVATDPRAAFPRYGLAMELVSLGRLSESATLFDELVRDHHDYVPSYFQAGKVMERLGRIDRAREIYRDGIAAAERARNAHAREELEAALSMLG